MSTMGLARDGVSDLHTILHAPWPRREAVGRFDQVRSDWIRLRLWLAHHLARALAPQRGGWAEEQEEEDDGEEMKEEEEEEMEKMEKEDGEAMNEEEEEREKEEWEEGPGIPPL